MEKQEEDIIQRIYFNYSRLDEVKYISHLDLIRTMQRAIRRAKIPSARTQGFNPKPRLSLAAPLPVGVTSEGEAGEIYLESRMEPGEFKDLLNKNMPGGIIITDVAEGHSGEPSLMEMVSAVEYEAVWSGESEVWNYDLLNKAVNIIKSSEEILVERRSRKGIRSINIRPFVYDLSLDDNNTGIKLKMFLQTGNRGGAKPFEVLNKLGETIGITISIFFFDVHRTALFSNKGEAWDRICFSK